MFNTEHAEARAGEVQRISLGADLAEEVLGWEPRVFLDEGIRNTWEWFRASNNG